MGIKKSIHSNLIDLIDVEEKLEHVSSNPGCLFIKGNVSVSHRFLALIDTGASKSVIDKAFYQSLPDDVRPAMSDTKNNYM